VVVAFDFEFLVQVDMFLSCFTIVAECASFLWLRVKEPNAPRPFRAPGGMVGAWCLVCPKILVVLFLLACSHYSVILVGCGIDLFVIMCYFLTKKVVSMNRSKIQSSAGEESASGDGTDDQDKPIS